jgi:hypothetical protein
MNDDEGLEHAGGFHAEHSSRLQAISDGGVVVVLVQAVVLAAAGD